MEDLIKPPRIENCKHFHGWYMDYLPNPIEGNITWQLLPSFLFWLTTQGAYFSPAEAFTTKTYLKAFPKNFILAKEYHIDGPFLSKEHAEECSAVYNLILHPRPNKAAEILLKDIKKKHLDFFERYINLDFIDNLTYILEHTFTGHIRNGLLMGIHYNTSDVKLIKPIKSSLKSKSPYFIIERVDPSTNIITPKKAPSTFWPSNWSVEKCVMECAIAWSNKTKVENGENFTGFTSNQLKIIFCFRNGTLKTVFPDSSNNEDPNID